MKNRKIKLHLFFNKHGEDLEKLIMDSFIRYFNDKNNMNSIEIDESV